MPRNNSRRTTTPPDSPTPENDLWGDDTQAQETAAQTGNTTVYANPARIFGRKKSN